MIFRLNLYIEALHLSALYTGLPIEYYKEFPPMKKITRSLLPLILMFQAPAAFAEIECELTEINAWDFGFVLNQIQVKNTSDQPVANWNVYLHFDRTIQITNAWGGRYNQKEGKIFHVTPMDYNDNLLPYDSVYFGLQGELSSRLATDNIQCLSPTEHQAYLDKKAEDALNKDGE